MAVPAEVARPPAAPHRTEGIVLVVIAIVLAVPGLVLQFYPTVQGCTGFGFFGYCSQMGPVHPYAGVGDLLLALFTMLFILGVVLAYWRPSPPNPEPVFRYIPVPVPPPPPPPPPPSSQPATVVVQVNQAAPQPPRIMMRCRNCGSVFDMALGRCDRCGAPAA